LIAMRAVAAHPTAVGPIAVHPAEARVDVVSLIAMRAVATHPAEVIPIAAHPTEMRVDEAHPVGVNQVEVHRAEVVLPLARTQTIIHPIEVRPEKEGLICDL
jgi:hypothetical protein